MWCNADDGSVFLVQVQDDTVPFARDDGTQYPEARKLGPERAGHMAERCRVGIVERIECQRDEEEKV